MSWDVRQIHAHAKDYVDVMLAFSLLSLCKLISLYQYSPMD